MSIHTHPKEIVVSGMRPTGNIHLGNYNAVIKNWLELQNHYTCFFFIADVHARTTNFNGINIKEHTFNILNQWLAAGIDPNKCTLFIQSEIPEIFELHVLLSMVANISRLERIPNYKSEKDKVNSYGFLGYPILQAADVLILNAKYVPIGEDQLPHLEFIREISKKINTLVNKKIFNEPIPLLYKHKKILGHDGFKMSKSKNNTILITDKDKELKNKINKYTTDPNRQFRSSLGTPENCNVWHLHKIYSTEDEQKEIEKNCKSAQIGCVECKNKLFLNLEKENNKIINNIERFEPNKNYLNDIIKKGREDTREIAANTLSTLKKFLK